MKKKCAAVILVITLSDLLAVFFITDRAVTAAVCFAATAVGVELLYYWLMKPILALKKQLEEIKDENQKAENIRKEFVANVTHELKTPLTSISGFIETLQDGAADDPEIRTKFIDIIAIETARLKRLIEDILVLSDIENKKETDPEKINIRKSIEETAQIIRPIAEMREVEILTDINEELYITGSDDRFRQMMVNLIENAVKYSNPGGRVWVSGKQEYGRTVICVRDEGIGIAKEHLERLFERFYRVDKSRSKKVGGTGLGLSIVKHIAALLDAELKVESELGKGSSFYVIF